MAGHMTHSRDPLLQLKVVVSPEDEERVASLLEDHLGQWPTSYSEPEKDWTELSLFLPIDQRPSAAELAALRQALHDPSSSLTRPRLTLTQLQARDWKESWKHHFKPIEIGRRLLLRPSWSHRRARPGQSVIVLDPGLSFGTGHHPTTEFCLRQLVRHHARGQSQSLLDIGTGSGLLAIAGAKLGYGPIEAFDFDPDSVRVASANARKNRVLQRMTVAQRDLTRVSLKPRQRFDVVCANLLAPLLIEQHQRILNRVSHGGVLIIAGILQREFDEVDEVYRDAGARRVASTAKKEWRSGAYRIGS